jgi:hypothetical protein
MTLQKTQGTIDLSTSTDTIDWSVIRCNPNSLNLDSFSNNSLLNPDIKLGDISLKDFITKTNTTLASITERLNILEVNHELEKDWKELQNLGQQYRQLEKEILDKMNVWNRLK